MDSGPCADGETTCGSACIAPGDCAHAISTTVDARRVCVNGATFKRFAIGSSASIKEVRVGGALAAFRADGPTALWVEIPPGRRGVADVLPCRRVLRVKARA